MEELSLQQYYRDQIEEKRKADAYSDLLEDTVQSARYLNLRGKSRTVYLEGVYRAHKKGLCRDVPKQKFFSAILSGMEKQKNRRKP